MALGIGKAVNKMRRGTGGDRRLLFATFATLIFVPTMYDYCAADERGN